ncbi:MAG: serine/threonine-protein phosphatase [Phycisphaerae bacterium]|nr:serine/threonine-protein phosphatase [Phycisphaerae bacterium]
MQVLLVDPGCGLPPGVGECLAEDGWRVSTAPDYKQAVEVTQKGKVAAVVVPQPTAEENDKASELAYRSLIRTLHTQRIATVLIADNHHGGSRNDGTLVDVAARGVTKEELRGRLSTVRRYHALVCGMEREVENLQRISKRINQHFNEVEQQMRLAGRLQRDFLPRHIDSIGPVRFATLFRPVTWVSGDTYDIFRVDEKHVGFYIADAVGHGMAAGLLTMFIRQAVVPKEIVRQGYRVLDPGETLAKLNEALTDQALPNCQFATACYCLLNTETLELQFARGGHPHPLLITQEGHVTELKCQGGLLGLFKGETFPTSKVHMRPGEKLILYTDGIEVSFAPRKGEAHSWEHYRSVFEDLADHPIEEIIRGFEAKLDNEAGSLNPKDDVTVVGMQIRCRVGEASRSEA